MQLTDEMKFKLRIPYTGNALDPKFQPQVAYNPDNFQFQTTGVKNITQTLTYQWQNTGTVPSALD